MEGEKTTISITPQLEYVPVELIHHIQSLLPAKDAARTCVLSKSWLHAWSTIPTLRFTSCAPDDHLTKKEELQYIKFIDRNLLRYLKENLSINSIQLHLDIEKLSLPSLVENWFQVLASGNCLKELSLKICGKKLNKNEVGWLTIPDAIFSCENLNTINLRADKIELYEVRMNINPVIKCSFLHVLQLENVCISEGALHNLFSSCSLLEKVREALDLSSNFDIEIIDNFVPLNIRLDDLRRMVPFPGRNVQLLSFGKHLDKKLWKHSPLFDFIFSICYPRYVKAYYRSSNGKNYWHEQMVGMMEQKMCDLKDIEIKKSW